MLVFAFPINAQKLPYNSSIVTGGVAVVVFQKGTFTRYASIQNPPTATESLFVDFYTTALAGQPTTFELVPGAFIQIQAPINKDVSAVAATSGHAFTAVAQ